MKSKKIIIIISVCILAIIGGVIAAFLLKDSSPKPVEAENVSEVFEIAKKNGFEGTEEELEKIILKDNDTKQKGIAKVYVDEDKRLIIEMENGVTIDAGDANVAVKELIQQSEESANENETASDSDNSTGNNPLNEGNSSESNGSTDTVATQPSSNESPKDDDEKVIFTVVFKDDDGTVLKTENVIIGKSATPPPEPKKNGYIFDAWDTVFSYVKEDLVVTAQYKKSTAPTITLSSISVKAGTKTATVDVSLANNPGISSLVLDINYPKELKLKSVDFNQSNLDGAMATTAKPITNPQRISIINSTKEIKTNGVYATLTFELPTDLKTDFSGNIIATYNEENVFDIDMNNVQFDTINGKILISK